jgi:ABC-type Fe3+ transport system permease subunit
MNIWIVLYCVIALAFSFLLARASRPLLKKWGASKLLAAIAVLSVIWPISIIATGWFWVMGGADE